MSNALDNATFEALNAVHGQKQDKAAKEALYKRITGTKVRHILISAAATSAVSIGIRTAVTSLAGFAGLSTVATGGAIAIVPVAAAMAAGAATGYVKYRLQRSARIKEAKAKGEEIVWDKDAEWKKLRNQMLMGTFLGGTMGAATQAVMEHILPNPAVQEFLGYAGSKINAWVSATPAAQTVLSYVAPAISYAGSAYSSVTGGVKSLFSSAVESAKSALGSEPVANALSSVKGFFGKLAGLVSSPEAHGAKITHTAVTVPEAPVFDHGPVADNLHNAIEQAPPAVQPNIEPQVDATPQADANVTTPAQPETQVSAAQGPVEPQTDVKPEVQPETSQAAPEATTPDSGNAAQPEPQAPQPETPETAAEPVVQDANNPEQPSAQQTDTPAEPEKQAQPEATPEPEAKAEEAAPAPAAPEVSLADKLDKQFEGKKLGKAYSALVDKAAHGDAQAQKDLAVKLFYGQGHGGKNTALALELYESAAKNGSQFVKDQVAVDLAYFKYHGLAGIEASPKDAVQEMKELAKSNKLAAKHLAEWTGEPAKPQAPQHVERPRAPKQVVHQPSGNRPSAHVGRMHAAPVTAPAPAPVANAPAQDPVGKFFSDLFKAPAANAAPAAPAPVYAAPAAPPAQDPIGKFLSNAFQSPASHAASAPASVPVQTTQDMGNGIRCKFTSVGNTILGGECEMKGANKVFKKGDIFEVALPR